MEVEKFERERFMRTFRPKNLGKWMLRGPVTDLWSNRNAKKTGENTIAGIEKKCIR